MQKPKWEVRVHMEADWHYLSHPLSGLKRLARAGEIKLTQASHYASHDYQKLLAKEQIQVNMSRSGNRYDNAMMESFFATLKAECVDWRFATRVEARSVSFD